jgi:hypothetical protein
VSPQPAVGRGLLKFPDGSQVGVKGLDDIMAELYSEDRKPNIETADEIIFRLEKRKNFIPDSINVRREYAFVLLKKYREYIEERSGRGS